MNNHILSDNKWNVNNYKRLNYDNTNDTGYCPLEGILEKSKLSLVYFSKENLNLLDKVVRQQVWLKSNKKYKIGKQSSRELLIIMRSIYLKYSKNLDCKIKEQIAELNDKVIDYCVEVILTNIKQQTEYINELDKPLQVFGRGVATSIKGDKTNERTRFI